MGVSRTFCYLLQRILVPLVLASAVILRQNILSTIYLILLLLAPLLPVPTPENVIKGVNGIYLKVIIGLSSAANLAHIISQIVFLAAFNYSSSIDYCSTTGQILNLIGLHRLNGVSFFNILRLCCLDFVVLLVSCLVYAFCSRTYHSRLFQSKESITPNTENRLLHLNDRRFTCEALSSYSNAAATTAASAAPHETTRLSADFKLQLNRKRQKMYIAQRLSYCVCEAIFFLALCASAILEPSLTSSVYFLYFLFIGSWFALDKSFGTGYHYFRIFIALFVAVHFFSIFLYQFMLFRPLIPPTDMNARLFGLVEYTQTNCTNVRDFVISDYHFVRFFHPIVLLVLYFVSINLIQTVLIQKKLSKLSRTIYQSIDDEPTMDNIRAQRSLSMNSESNDQDHDHDHSNLHKSILSTQSVHLNYVYDNRFNDNTPLLRHGRPNRTYSSVGERSTSGPFERTAAAATTTTRDGSSSIIVPPALDSASAFSNIHSNVSLATTSLPPTTPTTPNTRNLKSAWPKDNNNQFSLFFIQLFDMIKRASYVITLIVMMTWSITYHSWLSFVLLLSSCIIWMTPNSRQTCLNSSPILVFYALLLVIGQYIYSLNLTDQELPAHIGTVSISEIGFKKYGEFSYQPLFVKIFYTMFFWITLRQYTESLKDPETEVDAVQTPGILSPLFNLGPAVRALSRQHTQTEFNLIDGVVNSGGSAQSKLFDSMIKCFKEILVKYWIWIVAIMLMVMSLSGSKVVIYRIVYMFLFLIFIWLFLISLKWWRKLIYPFWLVVILYSMIILIAIYTYQFNCFPDYWEQYLYIDKELQEDLGLVVYDNDAFVLFKELLTPTFFIIITIIQVHFVHKDFLELSNIDEIRLQQQQNGVGGGSPEYSISMDISNKSSHRFSSQASLDPSMDGGGGACEGGAKSDLKSQPSQSEISVQTVISKKQQQQQPTSNNPNAVAGQHEHEHESGMADCNGDDDAAAAKSAAELNRSKASLQKPTLAQEMHQVCRMLFRKIRLFIHEWMVVFWRFLEIHIMKFVFLCAVNIIIRDISVMNVVFVFLSIFLMVFNKFETTICFIFAIWSGLLVLLKMLFQLNIAQRIEWHTNCTFDFNQTTIDNRQYIGFLKTDDIFSYIWEYILLIIILVFRVIILLRQSLYRNKEYGDRLLLDFVIFPEVNRSMADKDFRCFIKYLFNFGFYKFGVEICLILVTISIGNHGDIFSVLYCLFLTLFVLFNRQECARFWAYFVGFMAVALPYQYLMCLGIPPGLCLEYPWKNIPPSDLEWYFLPDFRHQLPKDKLYLDFLLFFLLCRQLLYFRLEPKLIQYGGSNLEAYREKTPPNVSDFFSFGQSMFDTFKSYFLFCFFWITLAILFLAGTTRINLFGLGYVLGSFIFLWNGNEFYLKPSNVIFKLWKIIIGYTCMAMLLKSILQVFVLTMLRNNLCNVVQLMGISYAKESVDPDTQKLLDKCPINEAGLLWDGICFTFLLVQKRIFCSHYFKFLVREIKAQHFLASRGAELIHEIQAQEVAEQEIAEREVMEKIKQKMDRIKEAQQKMFANKARSIKYHKQDEYDYDISPYSGVDETLSQASEADDLFSQTLPTVYSPTPSIPTITSPQSATTLQPGYFEVYSVWPIRPIDASSSSNTIPSFSLSSNVEPRSHSHSNQLAQPAPQLKIADDGRKLLKEDSSLLKVVGGAMGGGHAHHHHPHPLHPQPHHPHRSSLSSSAAMKFPLMAVRSSFTRRLSHASSVKSGGYYMFEDGEDTEICDLSHKTRGSLIPDPEGDEIKNLAKSKGFTAFCSKIFKGEDPSEAALVSAESTDVGESSKDSAIVSVERLKPHPDSSRQTTMTSIPVTSQETDISNMSSLASSGEGGGGGAQDPGRKSYADIQMAVPPPATGAAAGAVAITSVANVDAEMQPEEDKTYLEKINSWFDFIKKFAESILISSTSNLNSVSRDYRFVAKRLAVEKKCLKKIIEIKELDSGHRHDFISDQNWKKSILSKLSKLTEEDLENVAKSDPSETRRIWDQLDETSCEGNKHLYLVSLDSHYMDRSIYIHFFRAIFYAILSRSEVICYITIVINQITSASILSLPLPLMAFLWGSLSVPRPSKSFWVTCITYIEVVVVLKYVFQFRFWEWNTIVNTSPFWWPRILGIEKKDNYANYDLVLLLVLFFHRFMLKSLGLWDLSETEIKAYMTNAELFQSRQEAADDQQQQQQNKTPNDNNGNGNGGGHGGHGNGSSKRLKKKKSKTKSDKATATAAIGQQPLEPGEPGGGQKLAPARLQSTEEIIPMTIHSVSIDEINNIDGDPTGEMMVTTMMTNNQNNNQNQIMLDDNDDDDGHDINVIYLMMETPTRIRKKCLAMVKPAYKFFHNVLHPPYRITHDVYSLMFLCDFINFFILVFGFYAFGSGYSSSEDVARFLEENKIPIGFLITLLIQFAQIIVDRAIYLRKYIKGKLIFQIIIVIFTHMWLFFVLPYMTDKSFTDKTNLPPKLWYVFKCIYFLLSAYQIRSGYPTRILGNTFCKKYNFVNWYLFKVYMLIPFVYDLRMYMDWIWTDTSLVLDEWSLMEDIFVNLYQRKCELKLDEEFPEPRGKPKKRFFKYLIGGSWVIIIIALIWGPLVLFAFGRAVGEVNPPIGATFELEIGGYQPLFKMSVTDSGLQQITEQKWQKLSSSFSTDAVAQTFISGYDRQDVYVVNLNGNSTAVWGISPPSQKILQRELLSNQTILNMKLTYYLIRKKTKNQDMDATIYDEYFIELHPTKDEELRRKLSKMISDQHEHSPAVIQSIFPNYLRAPEKGKPIVVTELIKEKNYPLNKSMNYRNLLILLKKGQYENQSFSTTSWWEIHDDCQNNDYLDPFLKDLMKTERCQYLPVVVFNDKVFIGLLAFLSGYGIIGIYTTFVFLVSRWVRGLNSESSFKVIYTRMPNVDRVLQLCLDIYLVRESREFELEEDLYAKLIFLYRSPETLIKWTKINEEIHTGTTGTQFRND